MKYSPSNNGFFCDALDYKRALPQDLIDLPMEIYHVLMEGQSRGMTIVPSGDNFPVLKEPDLDYISLANQKREKLIESALSSVALTQLRIQMRRGVSEADMTRLSKVLDYIDTLELLDLSLAPNISWPNYEL
jgi:hypothetical protein